MRYLWEAGDIRAGTLIHKQDKPDQKYLIAADPSSVAKRYHVVALTDGLLVQKALSKVDLSDVLNQQNYAPTSHSDRLLRAAFGRAPAFGAS